MAKPEDLLYEAYIEGIRDEVLTESRRLSDLGGEHTHMPFRDRLEKALNNIRKKNENI